MQAALTTTAAISGRVYGASGEPLGNVDVSALKPSYQDGRRILTAVQTMRTDDRGEYRLFWLPPGKILRARHTFGRDEPDGKADERQHHRRLQQLVQVDRRPGRRWAAAGVRARVAGDGTVRAGLFPGCDERAGGGPDRSQQRRRCRRRRHSAGSGPCPPRPRRRDQRRDRTGCPIRRTESGPESSRAHGRFDP